MNEKNKLTLAMGLFYLIVILFLGLIIISEKKEKFLLPKVKEKMLNYINKNYQTEKQNFKYSKISTNKDKYFMKIYHKNNKNLYFTVTYQKKKIKDTYKEDYLEGKTLNKYLEQKINKKLSKEEFTATYNTKLNDCTTLIKEELIKGNDQLPLYTINIEKNITNLTALKTEIISIKERVQALNLTPKNYNIIFNNLQNISKSIHLIIESETINNNLDEIITLIINHDFDTLKKYHVECTYLN